MTNFNKTLKLGLVTTLLSVTTAANATTVSVTASATVDNAIEMAVTGALGFGTVRASRSATAGECEGLVLGADPGVTSLTAANASQTAFDALCAFASVDTLTGTPTLNSIDGAISRPEFSITGVPAFQNLQFTAPSATTLTLTGNPPGAAVFNLLDFTAFQTNASPAAAVTFGATALTANASGEVTFTMGAVLATDATGSGVTDYQDAVYEGTFDVTVTY